MKWFRSFRTDRAVALRAMCRFCWVGSAFNLGACASQAAQLPGWWHLLLATMDWTNAVVMLCLTVTFRRLAEFWRGRG